MHDPDLTSASPSLVLGAPVFADGEVAALAGRAGAPAAWSRLLLQGDIDRIAAALSRVGGDFAVGLHDPASGRTVLAVDRFAMQTLCYRQADGRIQFAARADTLAGPDPDIDPQALFDYLYFHCIPSPRTVFRDVLRLPAGHVAIHEQGRLTVRPYWTPEFRPPTRAPSFESTRTQFRQLLQDAVRRQLDGSQPACFLSGGTDSSTVAGMIGLVAGRPAATYSIGFEAEGYDEMAYARIAARHFGTEHHEYYVTPDDLVAGVPRVAGHYDQPFGNSSALPAYYCARVARSDGVTRMLAGDGGDELFGGNARYAKQRVFDSYGLLPAALRRAVLEPLFGWDPVTRVPLLKKGSSYIEQAKVPMPDRLQIYNLLFRLGPREALTQNFLAAVDDQAPLRQQREVWRQARGGSAVDRSLAFDWRFTLAESDLPKVRDTCALADMSVGFPMLDDRLLELSMQLPANFKVRGLKLRWFFKEALRGFLPDEILTKKKQGFGLPFGVWMVRHAALRRLATRSLDDLAGRNIVRPDFLRALLDERLPEHPGYYGEMVWILMMLEQWLQQRAPNFRL